jgi:hypothetical protein
MARVLGALGFEVIHEANANKRKLVEAIDTFGQKLPKADIGLFYFAGHGVQVDGRNYLIPVGAHVTVERDVEFEAVAAERVLGQMEAAGNRVNIVMLDACRNNPYARSYRSAAQGLARMDAPKGSYVVFATSPGATAADGQGRNGLFTGNLLKYIQTPGLKLEEVIKRTRADVVQASGDKQLPWDSSSLTGDFFFVQTTAAMTPSIVQPTPGAPLPPTPGAPGSIPDLTQTIKAREEAEKKWTGWQKKMDAEFAKAKGYDANARLKAEEKAQVWTAFLAASATITPIRPKTKAFAPRRRIGKPIGWA